MNLGVIILLFNSLLSGKVSGRSAVHAILKMDPFSQPLTVQCWYFLAQLYLVLQWLLFKNGF